MIQTYFLVIFWQRINNILLVSSNPLQVILLEIYLDKNWVVSINSEYITESV